jgi:uncharacterized repeat protein (TIGR02543 family)
MYEEKKYSINWLKIFVTVIIGFLVIILSVKLVTMIFKNVENTSASKTMETNLKLMNDVAKSYFTGENLPEKVGDSARVSLQDLVNAGKVSPIKDKNGEECSLEESYIEATRLETEYQLKSYLACKNESDYLNTFMEDAEKLIIIKPETTTTTTVEEKTTTTTTVAPTKVRTTTKVVTTTATYYTVSFNSNGGSFIEPIRVKLGSVPSYPTPVREGYTFVGWYSNGSKFDTASGIYGDKVLVAKWTK